jgi:hypothetical protein
MVKLVKNANGDIEFNGAVKEEKAATTIWYPAVTPERKTALVNYAKAHGAGDLTGETARGTAAKEGAVASLLLDMIIDDFIDFHPVAPAAETEPAPAAETEEKKGKRGK